MKLKILINISFFLCFGALSFSQEFSRIETSGQSSAPIHLQNGNFQYVKNLKTVISGQVILTTSLIEIDSAGNLIGTQNIFESYNNRLLRISFLIKEVDGNYVFGGSYTNNSSSYNEDIIFRWNPITSDTTQFNFSDENPNLPDLIQLIEVPGDGFYAKWYSYAVRLNNDLTLRWVTNLGAGYKRILPLGDGVYYTAKTDTFIIISHNTPEILQTIPINLNGASYDQYDFTTDFTINSDSTITALISRYDSAPGYGVIFATLAKINLSGVILWEKDFNAFPNGLSPAYIQKDSFGDYILSFVQYKLQNNDTTRISLKRVNKEGDIINEKVLYTFPNNGYSETFNTGTQPILKLTDDYFLITTYYYEDNIIFGNVFHKLRLPPIGSICVVSADENSLNNLVYWEKKQSSAIEGYKILRETSSNNYQEVGFVHQDSLSLYIDNGADPRVTSYKYKIAVIDKFNFENNDAPSHKTIHLQRLNSGAFQWNKYEINNEETPVSFYSFYRDNLSDGNWLLIQNLTGNNTTFTDVGSANFPNARYRVTVNLEYPCTATREDISEIYSNIYLDTTLSINNIVKNTANFSIFPNVAQENISIQVNGNNANETFSYEIINTEGKKIQAGTITKDSFTLDLNVVELTKGLYFFRLFNENKQGAKRFIKI
jgi:hypothetical protein